MKIVLVFPPFYYEPMYNLPPLGLINLATAVNAPQHHIVILDFVLAIRQKTLKMGRRIYDDCADRILEESPDLVGFSAQCTTYPAILQISRRIKDKRPDIKVIFGGHNASFLDRITLAQYPFVDAVVRGEGEVTFQELVAAYEQGKDEQGIQGVSFRQGKKMIQNPDRPLISTLDDLSFADYGFLPPLSEYRDACDLPRSIVILEVGRGCPHECVYCSESIMWRRKTRTLSVPRLLAEMETLHREFGADCFTLSYDQFTVNRKFVESFCTLVIEKNLNHIPWYCISRLDSVDDKLLGLMKAAGCESMCYGIDSGSKRTLDFIRKKIDQKILYQRVSETAGHGIIPTLSFVVGFPEEEASDIDETLMLALRTGIVGNNNPLIQNPTVLPGTELHQKYKNVLVRRKDTYFALGLEFDEGKRLGVDDDLIDSDPTIFSSFYNVPCKGMSLDTLDLIATYFPVMVRFFPKTFLLLSLEGNESISDLFVQWMNWLHQKMFRTEMSLSSRECYLHFPKFVQTRLNRMNKIERLHTPDILKYETKSLEAAKFTSLKSPFQIDLQNLKDFIPAKSQNILIEEFDFHIPMIIIDLKNGEFSKKYPSRKTQLVFKQDQNTLEVVEINGFTRDFLFACNGEKTLEGISEVLFERHGKQMNRNEFLDACVNAVKVLGKGGFLAK